MLKCLNGGAVHIPIPTLERGLELCQIGGFDSLAMSPGLIRDREATEVKDLMATAGVTPGAWGVPFNWRGSREEYDKGYVEFWDQAEAMAAVGVTRCATWILPGSNEMNFDEFGQFHRNMLSPIATVLRDNGMSFGMEFIGPKTLRDSFRYPWIYTMGEMLRVGSEIGPNVGILLDLWHLYTSGGTISDVENVQQERISLVHINDAPIGIEVDALADNKRGLPGSTGVMPLQEFMDALRKIGYNGPVEAEPFDDTLKDLSEEARLEKVAASMRLAFGG
jgi:sugar phosphate isomerase/epimerase